MNIFIYFKSIIRLNYAIDKANRAHEKTGERYYVMPNHIGKLIVMNRGGFRKLKNKGYISSRATMLNIHKECFYCAPGLVNDPAVNIKIMEAKRKMYLEYVQATRKLHQECKKMK